MTIKNPIVLIVDDSENDAALMRLVFQRAGFVQPPRFAYDGDKAIAYLRGDGGYLDRAQFPLPTALLLDLNMPGKNGFETLAWIRGQPEFERLQVHILSASSRPEDIARAYDLGANSYLTKPGSLDGLLELARTLHAWLQLCHFAPLNPPAAARTFVSHANSPLAFSRSVSAGDRSPAVRV